MEQLELSAVVFGDRREILVEGQIQQLEGVDDFLRPVDQDEDVAEPAGLPRPSKLPLKVMMAGAGRGRPGGPGGRRLDVGPGLGSRPPRPVLGLKKIDDGLRLHAALGLDPGQVADAQSFELPERLKAKSSRPPTGSCCCWDRGRRFRPGAARRGLETVEHDAGQERAHLLPADAPRAACTSACLRGQLGAVGQGDRHEVVQRPAGIDEVIWR